MRVRRCEGDTPDTSNDSVHPLPHSGPPTARAVNAAQGNSPSEAARRTAASASPRSRHQGCCPDRSPPSLGAPRVDGSGRSLVLLPEFQSTFDRDMAQRVLRYEGMSRDASGNSTPTGNCGRCPSRTTRGTARVTLWPRRGDPEVAARGAPRHRTGQARRSARGRCRGGGVRDRRHGVRGGRARSMAERLAACPAPERDALRRC